MRNLVDTITRLLAHAFVLLLFAGFLVLAYALVAGGLDCGYWGC